MKCHLISPFAGSCQYQSVRENTIKIFLTVQELRQFSQSHFCLDIALLDVKWHFAIPLARSCQYMNVYTNFYQNILHGWKLTAVSIFSLFLCVFFFLFFFFFFFFFALAQPRVDKISPLARSCRYQYVKKYQNIPHGSRVMAIFIFSHSLLMFGGKLIS